MADLLATAAEWLGNQRKQHTASEVTYCRGADTVTAQAGRGKSEHVALDSEGFQIQMESQDFFILAADLAINGEPIKPKRGDKIKITSGAITRIFEVDAPTGLMCARIDPYGNTWRIFTRYTGDE